MNEENEEQEENLYFLSRSAQTEPETGSKKKRLITIVSVVAVILVLAGTYYVYRQVSVRTKKSSLLNHLQEIKGSQTDFERVQ